MFYPLCKLWKGPWCHVACPWSRHFLHGCYLESVDHLRLPLTSCFFWKLHFINLWSGTYAVLFQPCICFLLLQLVNCQVTLLLRKHVDWPYCDLTCPSVEEIFSESPFQFSHYSVWRINRDYNTSDIHHRISLHVLR